MAYEYRSSSRPPLILLASHQEWAARSLESVLGPKGYAVLLSYSGTQTLELARAAAPDALILDTQLPGLGGIGVCRALREDPRFGDVVPIFITAAAPTERAERLDAYEAGAWEYCAQPLDTELLLRKLETFILCKRAFDRLREESLIDSSTGLYNMKGLARRAQEIGGDAQRRGHPLACIAVSRTGSTETGAQEPDPVPDSMMAHLGDLVRSTGRVSDAIGRIGPRELAIIAPGTDARGAVRIAERLGAALQDTPVILLGRSTPVALRAGYCAVDNLAEATVDVVEILLRATTALRHLRESGSSQRIMSFEEVPPRAVSSK
jgi:diguanylate cyclase (GGDEF)-like protein